MLARVFLVLFSLALAPAAYFSLVRAGRLMFESAGGLWVLAVGFFVGLPFCRWLLRHFPWPATLEHETTHALVALLFLRRVTGFQVTGRKGGRVEYRGRFGGRIANDLIGLAPYYLPTLPLILALFRPLIPGLIGVGYDAVLGVALAFHVVGTWRETIQNWHKRRPTGAGDRAKQTDIGARGYAYSAIVILTFLPAFLSLTLFLIARGWPGAIRWGRALYDGLLAFWGWAWIFGNHLFLSN
jgi:hypothetical protein